MVSLSRDKYVQLSEEVVHFRKTTSGRGSFREGQILMNCLREVDYNAYMEVSKVHTDDPFYVDKNIPAFWKRIKQIWG